MNSYLDIHLQNLYAKDNIFAVFLVYVWSHNFIDQSRLSGLWLHVVKRTII